MWAERSTERVWILRTVSAKFICLPLKGEGLECEAKGEVNCWEGLIDGDSRATWTQFMYRNIKISAAPDYTGVYIIDFTTDVQRLLIRCKPILLHWQSVSCKLSYNTEIPDPWWVLTRRRYGIWWNAGMPWI